jgi:hypothetical protein
MNLQSGKTLLGRVEIDGRTVLSWMLKKCGGRAWTGFIYLNIGTTSKFL